MDYDSMGATLRAEAFEKAERRITSGEPASEVIADANGEATIEAPPTGGAENKDQGKLRFDLIPASLERAVASVMGEGAKKYAPRNWEKGMDWSRSFASLRRHLNAWWDRDPKDEESGLSHLHHAACRIAFLIQYESYPERYNAFDDRPDIAQENDWNRQ